MAALIHRWRCIRGRISFRITLLGAKPLLFISPDNGVHTLSERARVKWRNLTEWNCRNCLCPSPLLFFSLLRRILSVLFFPFSVRFHISIFLALSFSNPPLLSTPFLCSLPSRLACLIFYLCGGAAGWIRAWTGSTNHPDLQDSFSITFPIRFPPT